MLLYHEAGAIFACLFRGEYSALVATARPARFPTLFYDLMAYFKLLLVRFCLVRLGVLLLGFKCTFFGIKSVMFAAAYTVYRRSNTTKEKIFQTVCNRKYRFVCREGSCHKRQKPQAPTPQAPVRNRQTRKVANAKGLNRNTNLT